MSDPTPSQSPPQQKGPDPVSTPPAPQTINPAERRDFFSEAMREVLRPFTHIIEQRLNPILAALEQIPDQAERLANSNFGILDQPQPQNLPLPQHKPRPPARYLRPPGAMPPGQFESVCSRCGKCVEVCPASAIKLDTSGLIADGFPYIIADTQPCVVCDSLACMKSCPSGALKLVDRLEINMGTAVVDHQQCLRDHGEGCTLCIDVCPIDGKSPENSLSALFISQDTGQVRVRKNICIGCGLCESRCPTEPRAITVLPYSPPTDPIVA